MERSPHLSCRFRSEGAGLLVPRAHASYVSAQEVRCLQPAVHRPFRSFVEVSLDGQVYGHSLTRYDVVGDPVALRAPPEAGAAATPAARLTRLPPVMVRTVDANGLEVGALDARSRVVTAVLWPVGRPSAAVALHNNTARAADGQAALAGVVVRTPTAGQYVLRLTAAGLAGRGRPGPYSQRRARGAVRCCAALGHHRQRASPRGAARLRPEGAGRRAGQRLGGEGRPEGGFKSGCDGGYWRSVAVLAVVKRLGAVGGGQQRWGLGVTGIPEGRGEGVQAGLTLGRGLPPDCGSLGPFMAVTCSCSGLRLALRQGRCCWWFVTVHCSRWVLGLNWNVGKGTQGIVCQTGPTERKFSS